MHPLQFTFFGLLFLTACAARFEDRHGGTGPGRGILATGTCIKKISQDHGSVTLTTTVLAATATESSQTATKDSEKVRAAIEALKLPDATFETTGYSVYEEREYINKKTVSKGFRTRVGFSVETSDISRLGEVIAAASKLDVREIDNLATFVSPKKMKTEYESCLEIATGNARDKAEKLAKGAGVRLGKVISIEEGVRSPSNGDTEVYAKGMRAMAPMSDTRGGAAGPEISARSENLTVSASVKFAVD